MTRSDNMIMETDIQGDDEAVNVISNNEYPYKYLVTPVSAGLKDNFMSSPIKFGIAIKDSPFADAEMNEPVFNRGKGSVIISTKRALKCNLENAIKLGSWNVDCKLLPEMALSYGVIGPIDESEDLVAIKEELVNSGYPVLNIQRLLKKVNGQSRTTMCVKIGFKVKELPTMVKIWVIPFRVTRYMPPVRQCFKCQRFGHFSKFCNSKSRCLFCSEAHDFRDCPKEKKKCANCGGDHLANYGGCNNFQNAKRIEHMSAEAGVPYSVIKEQIKYTLSKSIPNSNAPTAPVETSTSSTSVKRSYASVLNANLITDDSINTPNNTKNEAISDLTLNKLSKLSDTLQSLLDTINDIAKKILNIITPTLATPILDIVNTICQILPKEPDIHSESTKQTSISSNITENQIIVTPQNINISSSFSGTRPKTKNNNTSSQNTKKLLGGMKRKDSDSDLSEPSKIPKSVKTQK